MKCLLPLLLATTAAAQPVASPKVEAEPAVRRVKRPDPKPKAPTKPTLLEWHGHAAFSITTPAGNVLWIDPWLENPSNPDGKNKLAMVSRADLIMVTHGHFDHVGNAVDLAKRTRAPLVATFDLGNQLVAHAGYPKEQATMATLGNAGGEVSLLNGDVTVRFVPAVHSSTVSNSAGAIHDGGAPGGFVISIKDGPTVYHTGDTDVFGDMELIGKRTKIDYMLGCIGGHFTMDPEGAAEAIRLVRPRVFVPMHYGTFPLLAGTAEAVTRALRGRGSRVMPVEVGKPVQL